VQFSAVQLVEWSSKEMCLQPALEDAECFWRSDTGWQTVPDARSSDEERPVTNINVERPNYDLGYKHSEK